MPVLKQGMLFANRYQLKKYIGVGGYSEVWLAEDTYAGSLTVALKVFAAGNGLDEKGLDVFSKEYSLVFDLRNEHLLIPKHFDICNNSPYLVLPYCRNGSALGKAGEMSENDMALFMHQAAAALDFLHTRQPPIIHQDIKPDNFLIDDEGNYLLADFGISSRIRRTLTKSMGKPVDSAGTIPYMGPERFGKYPDPTVESDIWSLGAALFELLTEKLPFGDQGGILQKSGAEIPDPGSSCSVGLARIIYACLSLDPAARPAAKELMHYAGSFLQTGKWPSMLPAETENKGEPEPVPGQKGRETQKIPTNKKPILSTSDVSGNPPAKHKRPWLRWLIIVAVLVIVAGIVAIIAINSGQSDEEIAALKVRQDSLVRSEEAADSIAKDLETAKQDSIKSHQNDSITRINEKYLGEHLFSCYFIGGDVQFGKVNIKEKNGVYSLYGKHEKNSNYVIIDGTIKVVSLKKFEFTGTITAHNNSEKESDCVWRGTTTFRASGSRVYWRTQNQNCFGWTGDMDIYFKTSGN